MAKYSPSGFIVVLPQTIIEIPQDSNLSWLTLFYALPQELVEKRTDYLNLPRNIHQVLTSDEYRKLIQTDTFLELVWDCYAWSAWQFFQVPKNDGTYQDIPGDWKHYSGDFPLWRLSYEIIRHFRSKFEMEMEWSFQRLFLMDKDDEMLFEIADPREEFESRVLSELHMEQFKGGLTEQDRQILQMRYEGYPLKEIAGAYEDFVSDEYSDFLDEHTTK